MGAFFNNAIRSLVGATLPLGVGLATMPILISQLGVERFGNRSHVARKPRDCG